MKKAEKEKPSRPHVMVLCAAICITCKTLPITEFLNCLCIHHKIDEPSVRILQLYHYTILWGVCKDGKINNFTLKSLLKKWKMQKYKKI